MGLRGLRAVFLSGAAIVLTLALIGCGGSSEPAVETVPPMTPSRLAKRLGEICQEHTDRQVTAVKKFRKEHGSAGSVYESVPESQLEKELIVVILPIVRDNIHDLESKLRPSPSQEATLKAFIEALEHGIEVSEEDPSWVTGTTAMEPFRHARFLSVDLGTPLCGQA